MSQFGFPLVSRLLVSRLLPVDVVLLGLVLSSTWAQEGPPLPGTMVTGPDGQETQMTWEELHQVILDYQESLKTDDCHNPRVTVCAECCDPESTGLKTILNEQNVDEDCDSPDFMIDCSGSHRSDPPREPIGKDGVRRGYSECGCNYAAWDLPGVRFQGFDLTGARINDPQGRYVAGAKVSHSAKFKYQIIDTCNDNKVVQEMIRDINFEITLPELPSHQWTYESHMNMRP